MEIRSILEGEIYGLFMNPISGRCEESVPVAASSDYQKLVDWYESQRCEIWRDGAHHILPHPDYIFFMYHKRNGGDITCQRSRFSKQCCLHCL